MNKNYLKYLFVFIQFILYGTFLVLDLLANHISLSNYIKFVVVVLCFIYVLYSKKEASRQHIFLCGAMAFTVASDIFLLLTDYYLYGVLTFIIAQQLYGIRITELIKRENIDKKNNSIKELLFRIVVQLVACIMLCILLWQIDIKVNSLLVVSVFYFISIVTNVVRCIKLSINYRESKDIKYFAIGMILFLLCDINVGLFNLSSYLSVGLIYRIIYNVASILMWTFYAPSQVMIALSGDTIKQN